MIVPDMIEPIVGWRTWRAKPHQGAIMLGSLVWQELWRPNQVMKAECVRQARANRDCCCGNYTTSNLPILCSCGIYAHRTYQQLVDSRPTSKEFYRYPLWKSAVIHGEVNLWGRVIQAKNAYRAQYAYPKKLMIHAYIPEDLERCQNLCEHLGKMYNVPARLVVAY